MNKFLIATLISLTPYNTVVAENTQKSIVEKPQVEQKLNPGCLAPSVVNDVLDKGEYEILVRGQDPVNRVIEVWFNGKKELVVVVYEKPKDNKQENIKEVCISGFGENIVFNGDAVEILKRALDHVNPKT